jgi:hypothetical protein
MDDLLEDQELLDELAQWDCLSDEALSEFEEDLGQLTTDN